jgi:hypothetical protein
LRRRLSWDDGFCIIAAAFLTIFCALAEIEKDRIYIVQALARGDFPPNLSWTSEKIMWGLTSQAKIQFAAICIFFTCVWACKLSLLMFYREIYRKLVKVIEMRNFMKWWWIVVGCCIISYLLVELSNVLVCLPVSRRWHLGGKAFFLFKSCVLQAKQVRPV